MTTGNTDTTTKLLLDLEPVVEANLNRHLATAKEWFPHEYVPWSQGRDFDGPMGGEAWEPGQSKLSEVARTSLIVNLLTEDNLPSYHYEIATRFGRDGAWGTWVHRWTAEEGRHGIAIRDYLLATRAVDPIALERARMTHMEGGFETDHPDVLGALAYVSFQELATRVSHRNTGRVSGDPVCDALLAKVAADENLHMLFYRNLLTAAFELAPDDTMAAITRVVKNFQMPGHTIENFGRKSVQIAVAGIYDLRIHHDEVVMPVLRQLKALERANLSPEGEKHREELVEFLAELDRQATRFEDKRAAAQARAAARTAA
ncbi:acyl-ACP desaturase [Catellatospora bangladeshensis]|uniref:Acyl-ACP desaturase n=1 Tax=Catellatospora bangladeshensis TaxID=310355 RepID=A0A8J3JQZ3_9ACTN|nr:acyl-ACP desaturase [Catellatospora bangladeshensis]GIF83283.1 acyl-ACP desaturase [Catellatospora bangladeshensis]